jgi:hypothetical protein
MEFYLSRTDCYRSPCGKLVFIRNDKCASTYHSDLFRRNNWQKQMASSIDWDKDHVFSFIRDPYVRHIQGIIEDLIWVGIEKPLVELMSRQFWKNLPWIGSHSMPMTIKFGNNAAKIDWIPIDVETLSSRVILNDLLSKYNLTIEWYTDLTKYESDAYKKELFAHISKMSPYKNILLREVSKDYELYDSVLTKYNIPLDHLNKQ